MAVLSRRRPRFHKLRKNNAFDNFPPDALCCRRPVVNGFGQMVTKPDITPVLGNFRVGGNTTGTEVISSSR
jgi:hypothetical protein